MFEKIGKHSVKILVFFINILLAAIAVLIIRERDQAKILDSSREKQPDVDTSSFKENLNLDSSASDSEGLSPEDQFDSTEQNPTDNAVIPTEPVVAPSTAPSVPAPTVKPTVPDRKTKTS